MTVDLLTTTKPGLEALPPTGRGTWRLTLHRRQFAAQNWQQSMVAELAQSRGRVLEQQLNQPAKLSFTLNGRDPATAAVAELQTDVIAWRWDAGAGADVPYFRGVVAQSEDQISEQAHVVNFTAHDYSAILNRRYLTRTLAYAATEVDTIVTDLLLHAHNLVPTGAAPTSFLPASYLPLAVYAANPNGTNRTASGVTRIRNYYGQTSIGKAINDLALVAGGFDYDIMPAWRYGGAASTDYLRVFYPQQGVTRTTPVLEYGGTVATVTRAVDSSDYSNYWRVLGNNSSADPSAAQLYSETNNADAVGTVVGTWQNIDNGADVTLQATLDQQVAGDLALYGTLVPHYTLGLRPGTYAENTLNMGDVVPIVINSGRLAVNTTARIMGLTFNIGDDGQEDVSLILGRPLGSLSDMLAATAADVNALARR